MSFEFSDLSAAGQIPESQRVVVTARQRGLAVRRNGNRPDHAECPSNFLISRPLARSRSLREAFKHSKVSSSRSAHPPDSAVLPSGAKATELTSSSNFPISRPLANSQSLSEQNTGELEESLSQLSDSAVLPSGAMATDSTQPECPSNFLISRPLARSQSLSVPSQLPDSAVLPSGAMATELT